MVLAGRGLRQLLVGDDLDGLGRVRQGGQRGKGKSKHDEKANHTLHGRDSSLCGILPGRANDHSYYIIETLEWEEETAL